MSHANVSYTAHNFIPNDDVFACPRDFDLGQRERDHAAILRQLRDDVATAEASKDAWVIETCRARLAFGEEAQSAFEAARAAMLDAEQAHDASVIRTQRAWARRAAGTLDAKEAVKIEHEVIGASAEERARRAALPGLRAQVSAASGRLMKLKADDNARARAAAIESSTRIVAVLLDERADTGEASRLAARLGKEASPLEERWWAFGDVGARKAFTERAEKRRAHAKEHMRTLEKDLDSADLDRCLAARQSGLDGARREALAKAEELARFATGAA